MKPIDADELKTRFFGCLEDLDKNHADEHYIFGLRTAIELIDTAPTIDTESAKHGHWIRYDEYTGYAYAQVYKCSECSACTDSIVVRCDYKFCPNCGAKMDEI